MLNRFLRLTAAASLPLIVGICFAPSATADSQTFHDAEQEVDSPADVTRVKVENGSKRVRISARVGQISLDGNFTFWIDTEPKNAGPEYKALIYPNSDGIFLMRVGSFSDRGKAVRCDRMTALADAYGSDLVDVSIPRTCIKKPGRVRATVRAEQVFDEGTVIDWAPGKNESFGWVKR